MVGLGDGRRKRVAHAAWLVGGFALRAGERGHEFVSAAADAEDGYRDNRHRSADVALDGSRLNLLVIQGLGHHRTLTARLRTRRGEARPGLRVVRAPRPYR